MSDLKMPAAMAELRPGLRTIISEGSQRAPGFSVLLSSRTGLQIRVDNREERVTERAPTAGTVLSLFDGTMISEQAVGGFERGRVQKAARSLTAGGRSSTNKPPIQNERHGDYATATQIDPMHLSVQAKLDRCRELHRRAQGRDARVTNVQVSYSEFNQHSVFADAHADLAQRVQRVHLFVIVYVAGADGQVRYNWKALSGTGGWELLTFSDEDIQSLVSSAVALLEAERIEPGDYDVITSPGVSGTICHESFGHGVETDMFLKERARAAQFVDRKVGSDIVQIMDDPGFAGAYGSYFFDDEGQMATPTQIVEDGIFRRGITDLYSAQALGLRRSANGRRQDYGRKAYARMSNTFFGAGTASLEDMLAEVDHGIYLDKWYSGMEDPHGWGVQVSCHYGHEIKGGRITDRIYAPIGISGYVPEVLGSIRLASTDLELDGGTCGKGHKEYVQVASGGPHLLLRARLG